MTELNIRQENGNSVITVKIVPGSSSPSKVCGLLDGMLKIKIASPPEKGKANQCLIKFLAEILGVHKNSIQIISGQTNPIKKVQIDDIKVTALLEKLDMK